MKPVLAILILMTSCAFVRANEEAPLLLEGPGSKSKLLEKSDRLLHLDSKNLETADSHNWGLKNFTDEKFGVSISVSAPPMVVTFPMSPSSIVSKGPFIESEEDIAKKSSWLKIAFTWGQFPEETVTVFIKRTESTFKSVIENPEMSLYVRYIALREIYELHFTREEQLALIKVGATDRKPEMRCMAMTKALDYKPLEKVIPICIRSLADPSALVQESALQPVKNFFDLHSADPNRHEPAIVFSGAAQGWRAIARPEVLTVARSIHAIRPDLLTEDDLKVIREKVESRAGLGD